MKRNGFTLVELLAVIIILAIVALIATPIVIDVIEDAKISTGRSEANIIYNGITNYCLNEEMEAQLNPEYTRICTTSMNKDNVKDMVKSGNATIDELVYDGEKLTTLVITSNNHKFTLCSSGAFAVDNESCEIIDGTPKVNISYNNSENISNGWFSKDVTVEITGIGEIKFCIDSKECEPTELIEASNNKKIITAEGINYVCAFAYNNLGSTQKKCESIKIDKTNPTIVAKSEKVEINFRESNDISNYFDISYGISGGNVTCTPDNTNKLEIGEQNVSCTAKGTNGLSASANISILVNEVYAINFTTTLSGTGTLTNLNDRNETYTLNFDNNKTFTIYKRPGSYTYKLALYSTLTTCEKNYKINVTNSNVDINVVKGVCVHSGGSVD